MQLEMFVAAVEEGTIRGASNRVFRTQPAVSMALSKLEDEFGVCLFVYSNHNRLVTEAGEMLYRYARQLLDIRAEAVSAVAELRSYARQRGSTEG